MNGRRRGTRTITGAAAAALLLAGGSPLAAQEELSRVELRARTMARIYDNFFRATDGAPEQTILGWASDARITTRVDRSSRVELFGEVEYVRYEELSGEADFTRVERLGESHGLTGGIQLGASPEVLRLRASYQSDRPAFNVGDEVRTANILRAAGDYSYRFAEDWEVGLEGHSTWVTFDHAPDEVSRVHGVGGSIRYRGVGYALQPELGGRFGWRTAEDPREEYRQAHLYVRLVSIPVGELWMSARYRFRTRSYPEIDPLSNNFGRSDEGGQWTLAAAYRASPNVHFNLYYDHLAVDSTRELRTFSSQLLTLGITVVAGS